MESLSMETFLSEVAPYIAIASFVVATWALLFAFAGYRRKTGLALRYDYAVSSSISSKDNWVCDVRLMNTKDRPATIYKIYVEDGPGIYVELDDFADDPLTLEAYGVFHKNYDPVDFYAINTTRIHGLLKDPTAGKRLVLTTPEGRHFPKRGIRAHDDPFLDTLLKNYTTAVARPLRLPFKGRSYGSEAKFLVTFASDKGDDERVAIYPNDYEIEKFRTFTLTKDSLASKDSLERFLQLQVREGKLPDGEIQVLDLNRIRSEKFGDYSTSLVAPRRSWFTYNVIGKAQTIWERLNRRRSNRKQNS